MIINSPLQRNETPEQLLDRIRVVYDAVDLENLSSMTISVINVCEQSGVTHPDHGKRILELLHNNNITDAEYDQLANFCI